MWTDIRRLSSFAVLWIVFNVLGQLRCCNSRVDEWYPDPLNAGEWLTSTLLAKTVAATVPTGQVDHHPSSPALITSATAVTAIEYPISAYANEILAQLEPSATSGGSGGSGGRMTYRYVNSGYLVATEYDGLEDCQGGAVDMIAHRLNRCVTRTVGSEMVSLMVTRNTTSKVVTTTLLGHRFDDDICQAYSSSYMISSFGNFGRCRRQRRREDRFGGSGSTSVDILRRSDEVVSMMNRQASAAHQKHRHHEGGILRTMYQTSDSCQQQREKEILRFDYYHSHCRSVINGTTSSRYHCGSDNDGGPVLLHFDTVDCQGIASEVVPLVSTCSARHSLYYSQYSCLPAQS